MGSADLPAEKIVADYADVLAELRRVEALVPALATVRQLAGDIERHGAAQLGARVLPVPVDVVDDDAVFLVRRCPCTLRH